MEKYVKRKRKIRRHQVVPRIQQQRHFAQTTLWNRVERITQSNHTESAETQMQSRK